MVEHETQKLKELDEEHSQELKEWREKLRPRKKVIFKTLVKICLCLSIHPSTQLLALFLIYSRYSVRGRRYRDEETKFLPPKGFRIQDQGLESNLVHRIIALKEASAGYRAENHNVQAKEEECLNLPGEGREA